MGGYGSGRRPGFSADKCEDYKSIDLAELKKIGIAQEIGWYTLRWLRGGEEVGNIRICREENGLHLSYRSRGYGEDWQSIDEFVPLTKTRTNFNGERLWFLCLSCRRRCRILYGGTYFRCRKCYGLKYQTQYEAPWERATTKSLKIRDKLGCEGGIDEPLYKPKGMHWKTFHKLEAEYEKGYLIWADLCMNWINRSKYR